MAARKTTDKPASKMGVFLTVLIPFIMGTGLAAVLMLAVYAVAAI